MEGRLVERDVTLVVVTHDRYFLESICTGILELDNGGAFLHSVAGPGCYDRYRQVRKFCGFLGVISRVLGSGFCVHNPVLWVCRVQGDRGAGSHPNALNAAKLKPEKYAFRKMNLEIWTYKDGP